MTHLSDASTNQQNSIIELEQDDLNQHESMCSFIDLLNTLVINKITPIYENGQEPNEMPIWMSFLNNKLNDMTVNENVKFTL